MQTRTAVLLSLGMLLEKVDTSEFIAKLLKIAKEENPDFIFTQSLQKQGFLLAETFNQGKIESETFASQLLKLLGIKTMPLNEFWNAWDQMVILGNIAEKVHLLQEVGYKHNALMYLSSDTNHSHFNKIVKESENQNIQLDATKQPIQFGQLPLYLSYRIGRNRETLVKHIIDDIRSKDFNKPREIILILGNPANIKDKTARQMAERECAVITAWCKENNVSVKFHNHSLEETFEQIFNTENIDRLAFKFA
ncbi:MAG: hypothetical protein H0W64_11810 [Gammaproteobacteria bacterium]|nr:hypothetical protein [Gammaproteobacteria bacterium]